MDFRPSPEQELLRDGARRYLAQAATIPQPQVWQKFAELGYLAMCVPEDCGGLAAPLQDITMLCEEMGRARSPVPFIGAALVPAAVLQRCDSTAQRSELLEALAAGTTQLAVAIFEAGRRYEREPRCIARRQSDGSYRLSGGKQLVVGGAQARQLIVSAAEQQGDTVAQTCLLLLDLQQAGVECRRYEAVDGSELADFRFHDLRLPAAARLAGEGEVAGILDAALEEAVICLCAEMLGAMDEAIRLSVDYLKIRKQFGRALAEFQALQHAMAEMYMDAQSARAMLYRALAAPPDARQQAAAGCFIKTLRAARAVTAGAVHLHGGVGLSCEHSVGHFLRRVTVAERLFGDHEDHLHRYLAAEASRR